MLKFALPFVFATLAAPAIAQDLMIAFADGAPKDEIRFESHGCNISNAIVLLDLAGSAGGLVFDTDPGGAGVEVYQPVEVTSGYAALSPVRDGDKRLQLHVHTLPEGEALSLSADLDDTLGQGSEITVNGSEMAGASVRLALSDRVLRGTFDAAGVATIPLPADASVCIAAIN